MKVLELFSGNESLAKVARERGHEVFTVDIDPQFKPDLCIDILDLEPSMIPFKPDIIWASPPCQCFSIMRVSHCWNKIKKDVYEPKNEKVVNAQEIVKKTLRLIEELKPIYWFIENPRAMLRKQEFMPNDKRKTITYCKYGFDYMKATDIWTNCDKWNPRPICKNGDPCHVRAPRGSKTGLQGIGHRNFIIDGTKVGKSLRALIPRDLCVEIVDSFQKP